MKREETIEHLSDLLARKRAELESVDSMLSALSQFPHLATEQLIEEQEFSELTHLDILALELALLELKERYK